MSDPAKRTPGFWFAVVATVVVAIAIVAGLMVTGGPGTGRLERLDIERLDDLRRIRHALDEERALPASLDSLAAAGRLMPDDLRDPTTDAPYGYRVLSDSTYEQCATFDLSSDAARRIERTTVGAYEAGVRHCFVVEKGSG